MIAPITATFHTALDVATGTGQAAATLANRFQVVYATDLSEKQIASADQTKRNVQYTVGSADKLNFPDGSLDLVTTAQAIHWFEDMPNRFYKEVCRVLRPRGTLAVWSYAVCDIPNQPELTRLLHEYHFKTLGPFWDARRRIVDDKLKDIHLPLAHQVREEFEFTKQVSLEHLVSYLKTWSSYRQYLESQGKSYRPEEDPLHVLAAKYVLRNSSLLHHVSRIIDSCLGFGLLCPTSLWTPYCSGFQ